MWEETTPFNNQEELTEPERYYINSLIEEGFEVRFDDERIYNRKEGFMVSDVELIRKLSRLR